MVHFGMFVLCIVGFVRWVYKISATSYQHIDCRPYTYMYMILDLINIVALPHNNASQPFEFRYDFVHSSVDGKLTIMLQAASANAFLDKKSHISSQSALKCIPKISNLK